MSPGRGPNSPSLRTQWAPEDPRRFHCIAPGGERAAGGNGGRVSDMVRARTETEPQNRGAPISQQTEHGGSQPFVLYLNRAFSQMRFWVAKPRHKFPVTREGEISRGAGSLPCSHISLSFRLALSNNEPCQAIRDLLTGCIFIFSCLHGVCSLSGSAPWLLSHHFPPLSRTLGINSSLSNLIWYILFRS